MIMQIGITPGEAAAIGPDLIIALAQQDWPAELVVCADPDVLQQRAALLKLPLTLLPYDATQPAQAQRAGTLTIAPFQVTQPVVPGVLNENNGRYVVDTLTFAGEKSMSGEFAAIVTGQIGRASCRERV